ncbi:MAG: hypothetical protein KatS3mg068_2589 [Candidatus Sericytochromatia bacterium]|nr:MAG: hypothetical protein KatS3mg068_2589 [Candidatus Sericytochromatia bacterium]
MSFDIIILTNGPGELSAWVKPVVRKLLEVVPSCRIIIALLPCPYASNEEYKVAEKIPGVSYVFNDTETSFFVLLNKLPNNFYFQESGIILQLGGDQFFSVLFKWRTKFPTLVYTEKNIFWASIIDKFLVPDKNTYIAARMNNISSDRLSLVGNLMVDAAQSKMNPIEIRERLGLSPQFPIVSLLPGSKPFKVKYSTSFLLKIADDIFSKRPDIQFIIPQSPYTPLYQIVASVTDDKYINVLGGVSAKFGQDKHGNILLTDAGTLVNIIPSDFQYEAFQISDVAITLPGTNTAELAVLGIPMITIFPTKKLDHIPIDGLLGRISDLPVLNKILKPFIIKKSIQKIKFISIPNQKAGYSITPEFVGNISTSDIADKAIEIIDNYEKRRNISMELRKVIGTGGADINIVDNILDCLFLNYPDIEILKTTNNFSDWTKKNPDND